jgi:hypothetical protein
VTPTDGAGAVPAGGGSSLPLPGGPGIDPAGITTGARGASLKRDAKAQVTPAHCIARSAARIELRHMAGARAAVGRRKASAPRSARAASDDAAQDLRLSALCLPLFLWRQKASGFGRHNPDADCVAGTIFHVVIAGLDPAIHAELRLALLSPFLSLHFSMDHRVKPGGDERKEERRRNSAPSGEAPHPTLSPHAGRGSR